MCTKGVDDLFAHENLQRIRLEVTVMSHRSTDYDRTSSILESIFNRLPFRQISFESPSEIHPKGLKWVY